MKPEKDTKTEAKAKTQTPQTESKKDALGGRIGTRMSAINQIVIAAGSKGATVEEIAEATGEKTGTINGQLGWMVSFHKLATRTEERTKEGKKTFRYFVKTGNTE